MKTRRGATHATVAAYAATEPLSLAEIVFPLRYDILAQRGVLVLAATGKHKVRDIAKLTVESLPFWRIWVAHERHRAWGNSPQVSDDKARRRAFKYHLGNTRKLVGLYKSISKNGFDPEQGRISFKRPVDDALTTEGHRVPTGGMFLTNGQHRLAALWGMSYREIPPEWYYIKEVRNLAVPEFTFGFVKMGYLTEQQFCSFARLRFTDLPLSVVTAVKLRDWAVDTEQPGWLKYYVERYWLT